MRNTRIALANRAPTGHGAYGRIVLMSAHSISAIMPQIATPRVYNMYYRYSDIYLCIPQPSYHPRSISHCVNYNTVYLNDMYMRVERLPCESTDRSTGTDTWAGQQTPNHPAATMVSEAEFYRGVN